MKYVPYFSSLTATEPESISWEKITEVLRSDFLREKTLKYRALLSQLDKAEASGDKNAIDSLKAEMKRVKMECPAIVCQAELEGGKDRTCIRGYTGYMMADFDHVPADRLNEALAMVDADPYTFVYYTTISGRGFRVIARVDGKVTERFSELVNPGRKILPRIAHITGITDDMVADKPDITTVIRAFSEFVGDSVLVGHNIKASDLYYIDRAARRAGVRLENPFFDTYLYAKRWQATKGWDNVKLEYLSEWFGIQQKDAHRAWCDAEANAELYEKLKELR